MTDSKLLIRTGILLGYSVGTRKLRYLDITAELSKTEDNVKFSLGHDNSVHELQVRDAMTPLLTK